ncbi:hypothetical protein LCGC14_3007500 [marine sediment metagenome]|uniref:Uncharacterized protein n=1 Tax=marine sediment metagenome TaxID=412755 RepID=A0A0F8WZ22_9ZZZZ
MSAVQEAWDVIERTRGVHGVGQTRDAIRNGFLVAHVDVCSAIKVRETPMTSGRGSMSVVEEICGKAGWLCEKAQEIKKLGMLE